MKYKPDESTIISYLYGELDASESEKVLEYLMQHPEEYQKVKQLKEVKGILSLASDKEVIAPPIISDSKGKQIDFWRSGYFKTMMSIAASFILILIAARLIGPEISYSNGELKISFNKQESIQTKPEINPSLSAQEVQQMINASLNENNNFLKSSWDINQKQLEQSIHKNFASNSERIDELMKATSQASQDQIRTFVAGLQEDNLKLMKDYLQLSAKDQNAYVESLLVDFSKYLQEQRKQDLQLFQTRMSSIEKNTDQFKQETEQILASIITNPETTIKRVNNY